MTGYQGETPADRNRLYKPRLSEQLADMAKSVLEKKGLSHQAKKIDDLLAGRRKPPIPTHPHPTDTDAKGGTVV